MLAMKGRASFLGERSRGHIDPGARSSQVCIMAICGRLAESREQTG
jgi:phosphoenolpyruvate---glycerone phosphotransferase subunit DhaL